MTRCGVGRRCGVAWQGTRPTATRPQTPAASRAAQLEAVRAAAAVVSPGWSLARKRTIFLRGVRFRSTYNCMLSLYLSHETSTCYWLCPSLPHPHPQATAPSSPGCATDLRRREDKSERQKKTWFCVADYLRRMCRAARVTTQNIFTRPDMAHPHAWRATTVFTQSGS